MHRVVYIYVIRMKVYVYLYVCVSTYQLRSHMCTCVYRKHMPPGNEYEEWSLICCVPTYMAQDFGEQPLCLNDSLAPVTRVTVNACM